MIILISGLVLWSVVHLLPSLAPCKRKQIVTRIGLIPYKIVFAVLIVSAIGLMILGWRSVEPVALYALPAWINYITMFLVLITFILFVAAKVNTNIKRVLRHPQLTGLVFWCSGHLLANGDNRSLVLFAGLLIWAKLEIILINRRDGKRVLPEMTPLKNDVMTVAGGIAVFLIVLFAHPYLSGVALV